jgi:hypothetical protein
MFHILDGAAEAREHMMIVGIDDTQVTPAIGQHEDGTVRERRNRQGCVLWLFAASVA